MTQLLILFGKFIMILSKAINLGNGSTWPGHIALSVDKNFIKKLVKKSSVKIILVIGTNGKTTTAKMIATILEKNGKTVFLNTSGANLLNGIASAFIANADASGEIIPEYAIFEVDENTFSKVLEEIVPFAVVALNLFRDQLDRYGELDSIGKKWKKALDILPKQVKVFLNSDDPKIAFLGKDLQAETHYFGLDEKSKLQNLQHEADSIYCPNCGNKLSYSKIYYSHVGIWKCHKCKLSRPVPEISEFFYPLVGRYNKYNTLAAVLLSKHIGLLNSQIENSLRTIEPAFGRQEKIRIAGDKNVQIFLAKNPTGFNQNLQTISELNAKTVVFLLNDRIPDGRDVSWIWDTDIESYIKDFEHIFVSGDRAFDMGLRISYSEKNTNIKIFENFSEAINVALDTISTRDTLFILPTYSAMLETRKLLTGKKIL